jgi:hypothetical protein
VTGRREFLRASAAAAAGALAGCAPGPTGGGPTTTLPVSDEPFTVVFIGDSEARMRGNTNAEIASYVQNLISYRSTTVRHFSYDGGRYRIDPELVVLGGDISADRDTSLETDMPLWQPLYSNGIAFIAGFGNHDWEPLNFGDGSAGYSVAGHLSNENTKAFTNETYRRSAALTPQFRYRRVGPTSVHGPDTFHASYRGVEIVNFNTFLYQPSYRYPEGWPLSCNVLSGGAGCQIFSSAEPQIERMNDLLDPQGTRTALFIQHYPLTTGDSWWSDYDVSGTNISQKKQRLLGLMSQFDNVALFAGHNHNDLRTSHQFGGRTLNEFVAPYFGGGNGDDPSRGGGFLAILVSPTQGILEVRTILTAAGPF